MKPPPNRLRFWCGAVTLAGLLLYLAVRYVPQGIEWATRDQVAFAQLSPEAAARAMTVPDGFTVELLAGEPDVRQPIAMCLDDRGRLWVAEAYCYPTRREDKDANDRILIFEPAPGGGKFARRTVFLEGLNLVSGLEYGHGGLWIGAAPYLLFVPIREGEDRPAGPPQILLDGWQFEDTHDTLNSFCWGPDGWLYGCQGVYTHSYVGKPGTPQGQRTAFNAGVWRYHPTRHVFEPFAHGTSNPWGLDFDAHGQAFLSACVVPHAFHVAQGGRYQRQELQHYNPHTYADIPTIADHVHWQGADPWAGNHHSDTAGGGHAHCGLMIYQGGAWPEAYRGQMFLGNVHGHRFNMDVLKPRGATFVASHGPDFLRANDAWARFVTIKGGPDGNAYFLDWYDNLACHTHDAEAVDRSNGRIYKVSYRGTRPAQVDLGRLAARELIDLLPHANAWYPRHALRRLGEGGGLPPEPLAALTRMAADHPEGLARLRALWALHAVGALDEARTLRALADPDPHVRAWAVQLALETGPGPDAVRARLAELAVADPSPVVRLYLAAALPRLPVADRWRVGQALAAHGEDAADPALPLMVWYGVEPLADVDAERALALALGAPLPPLLPFMARRIASAATPAALDLVVRELGRAAAPAQKAILTGLATALKGRPRVARPWRWERVGAALAGSPDGEVRALARGLAVTFGDAAALADLRRVLVAADAPAAERQNALAALLDARDPGLAPVLLDLVRDPALRGPAIRGLAAYADARTPAVLLAAYSTLDPAQRRDALATLAARAAYGQALLAAVAEQRVPVQEVPAEVVRQLRNLNDPALNARVAALWGSVRPTPADRARLIAAWKAKLQAPGPPPDLALGKAVFARTCQQCHVLYGVGGKVGPDITGSNRADLDYLLENILDPSALIPNAYKVTVFALADGRVVTGIVRGETPAAVTVVTANETLTLPRGEIDAARPSDVSMMPEDLLQPLSDAEVRALIAYLRRMEP